jgi:ABC-type bacteriocin/lantibiotic exporter with double-glycine peptidase domain
MSAQGKLNKKSKHYNFPIHLQQHDNTCGPACIAMIAEWATGLPQSEYEWCRRIKPDENGILPKKLEEELKKFEGSNVLPISRKKLSNIQELNATDLIFDENSVYLVLIDSFTIEAKNVGHWMVLVDSINKKNHNKGRCVVIYADPLENRLQAWDWDSMKAAKICNLYRITRRKMP